MTEKDNIKLVMSLPPFNQFGLEKSISLSNIDFIPLEEAIVSTIKKAKKTLCISSPFMDISSIPHIRELILNQAYLNVKIKILVREAYRNKEPTRLLSIKKFLKDAERSKVRKNISIKEYHYSEDPVVKSSIHAKFIIADGDYIYLGSGELRKNSIEKNFETGIICQGTIASNLQTVFLEIFNSSEEIK